MYDKLQELLEQRTRIADEMEAIVKKADAEKRDITDSEQETFDRLNGDFDGLSKKIEVAKKVADVRGVLSSDGRRGQRVPERATETDESRREERSKTGDSEGFASLGDMLHAVRRAADPVYAHVDKRLHEVRGGVGMNEEVPSDGGFLVARELIDGLLQRSYETGLIARDVERITVGPGKNGIAFNVVDETSRAAGQRYGGLVSTWTAEGGLKLPARPKLAKRSLGLQKLTALLYATDELLEDSVGLDSFVRTMFPKEFAFMLDDAILRGDGAGKPLGILASPATVTVTRATASQVNFDDILKMYARFMGENGRWYINRDVIPSMAKMSMVVGSGGVPVWLPANGAAGQQFSTLFGLPVIPIEQASTLGTIGDVTLADPKQYLLIEKGGLKTDVSIHVRFIYDESVFRFVLRTNGMPMPNAPLTPAQGSNTLSPFVTLL